jgi:hypothetical protein
MDTGLDNIIVLTPIASGELLQPFPSYPRIVSEMRPVHNSREVNINVNRSRLQHIFIASPYVYDCKWVILADSDVVITESALQILVDNATERKTACITTKGTTVGHVVTSCCILSVRDYLRVDYLTEPRNCQCKKLPNPFYIQGAYAYER